MDNNINNNTKKYRKNAQYLDAQIRRQILKNYHKNNITQRNIYLRPTQRDGTIILYDFKRNKKTYKNFLQTQIQLLKIQLLKTIL